jgi:hypothetical protein
MLFKIAPGDFVSPIYALSRTHLRGFKTASKIVTPYFFDYLSANSKYSQNPILPDFYMSLGMNQIRIVYTLTGPKTHKITLLIKCPKTNTFKMKFIVFIPT